MSVDKHLLDFSPDGEYLAYSSPDGCLKIWETSTNCLKQEYTPSSHLSATCSSISWCPLQNIKNETISPKKLKKCKSDLQPSGIPDLQLVAMGTLTGDILLYSYVIGDLYSVLKNGHTGTVHDLSWCKSVLYSCSGDQHIIVWDICSGKVKTKWKAGNIAVHSICVVDDNNLLSASNSILWWDVSKKTILKKFTGHATEVVRLLAIKYTENLNNCYFISSAISDRIINVWQLGGDIKKAVASFVLSDEAEHLSLLHKKNKCVTLSVVCKDGNLLLFEHMLNGTLKKPLQAKSTVQIASKSEDSVSKPNHVPLLAVHLFKNLDSCLISYGSFIKPCFEKMDLSEITSNAILIRENLVLEHLKGPSVAKVKHPVKPNRVKLLAPGHMMPIKDVQSIPQKRKKHDKSTEEMSMEEHLKSLDLSKIPTKIKDQEPAVRADSLVHLLLQGLQSKDQNMLNTVLQCSDEMVISTTLKRLPIQSIVLFLKVLQERLNKQEQRNHSCLKWLKGVLSVHLPYLMSCKDVDEYLGPISQLIEARVENFSKMCQLQGCLQLLLSSQTYVNNVYSDEPVQPLAVYQSESSEESSDIEHNDDSASEDDDELPSNTSSTSSSSEDSEMGF